MTNAVREYGTEGQRLLAESSYSQAEIARLVKRPKQRVSDWRAGRCRPAPEDRERLEKAVGVPARTWDAAPLLKRAPPSKKDTSSGSTSTTTSGAPAPAPSVPDVEALDLPSLGLAGLERLAARLRALEPSLPPRERVSALTAEARVLAVHEALRQKAADARAEYLASPEFLAEVRALLAVVPGPAKALRAHLARLGVALPPAPTTATLVEDPPRTLEDVDELLAELRTAKGFRDGNEPGLALAHTLSLSLDVHANALADLVIDDHARATKLLELVEGADEGLLRGAIERAMAVRDVAALPQSARQVVGELLRRLGHGDVAQQIDGGAP